MTADAHTAREIVRAYAARIRPIKGPVADAYEKADATRRDAIDDALLLLHWSVAGPHVQTGPSPEITARFILGARPVDLAPGLTRREAGLWIAQSDHESPLTWLWAQIVRMHQLEDKGISSPRSLAVARWAENLLCDPERRAAALRTRQGRIGEHDVEGSVFARLDELLPCDLVRSPVATIEAAAQRLAEASWSGPDELTKREKWHDRLPEGVTVLRTYSDLHTEGRECRHCVAAYAERVRDRKCVIVRVLAPDGTRSTAEIVRGKVTQHRGPRNESPSPACIELLGKAKWS